MGSAGVRCSILRDQIHGIKKPLLPSVRPSLFVGGGSPGNLESGPKKKKNNNLDSVFISLFCPTSPLQWSLFSLPCPSLPAHCVGTSDFMKLIRSHLHPAGLKSLPGRGVEAAERK